MVPLKSFQNPFHTRLLLLLPNAQILPDKLFNAGGLYMDTCIYKQLLKDMGYEVEVINVYPSHIPKETTPHVDVQLFIEKLQQPWMKWGRYNMFVINQEIEHDTSLYNQLNAIICKNKWAQLLVEDFIASFGKNSDLSNVKVWYTGGPIFPLLSRPVPLRINQ